MSSIKLLDCTLRDGGYINNWEFGVERIQAVILGLSISGCDVVECGFLQDKPCNQSQSLFNSVEEIKAYLPTERDHLFFVAMANCGGYDCSRLPVFDGESIWGIRVVFHKHQMNEAIEMCRIIKAKGYAAFLQPMGTDDYSDRALLDLIEYSNEVEPYAFYFVDSLGVMTNNDVLRLAMLIDHNLKSAISLGFHTHNNLQLAYSNIQVLLNMNLERNLILDSSIYGMGRGAGNLSTELLANYLNLNCQKQYNIDRILRVFDEHIRPLRDRFEWGYSVPYYLAAIHKCHPNYATYLINRATLPVTDIGVLLSKIPAQSKRLYSEKLITEMYDEYQSNQINDNETCGLLSAKIVERKVLLLGPGKSLLVHIEKLTSFIAENKPVSISVNYVNTSVPLDYAFFSNKKRFEESPATNVKYIVTSNIHEDVGALKVDYLSLCNQQGKFSDNALVMFLNLLVHLKCKDVYLAGFDGYMGDDYFEPSMKNIFTDDLRHETNIAIRNAIKLNAERIHVHFVTPSLYCDIGEGVIK
jgi:4-hydroxy 2-oxovalerate aldolase